DWLFNSPLYKTYWKQPVLTLKDTSLFNSDFLKEAGLYNYESKVSSDDATAHYIQFALQCDLYKQFKYKVSIEKRMMPCWNIKFSKSFMSTHKTKSTVAVSQKDAAGFSCKGVTVDKILQIIWSYHTSEYPFINQTESTALFDLEVSADMTN